MSGIGAPSVYAETVVPLPQRIMSEVLIEAHVSSVNPLDCKTMSGLDVSDGISSYPAVLGYGFSGIAVEAPSKVTC